MPIKEGITLTASPDSLVSIPTQDATVPAIIGVSRIFSTPEPLTSPDTLPTQKSTGPTSIEGEEASIIPELPTFTTSSSQNRALNDLKARYNKLKLTFEKQGRDLKSAKTENGKLKNKLISLENDHRLELKEKLVEKEKEVDTRNKHSHQGSERTAFQLVKEQKGIIEDLKSTNRSVINEKKQTQRELLDVRQLLEEEGVLIQTTKNQLLETQKTYKILRRNDTAKIEHLNEKLSSLHIQIRESNEGYSIELNRLNHELGVLQSRFAVACQRPQNIPDHKISRNRSLYSRSYDYDLYDDFDEKDGEINALRSKREVLESVVKTKDRKIKNQKTTINRLNSLVDELKWTISDLEEDQEIKAPLVQVGTDIRIRFLEQERISPNGAFDPKHSLDPAIIERGNSAAHAGNVLADQALFKAELISEHYANTFKYLYCWKSANISSPENIFWDSRKLMEAVEFDVTIHAGQGIHDGLGTSDERASARSLVEELFDIYSQIGAERFEQNFKAQVLLCELEVMKNDIVASFRRGRRR